MDNMSTIAYVIYEWVGPRHDAELHIRGVTFDEVTAKRIVNAHHDTDYSMWTYKETLVLSEQVNG